MTLVLRLEVRGEVGEAGVLGTWKGVIYGVVVMVLVQQ